MEPGTVYLLLAYGLAFVSGAVGVLAIGVHQWLWDRDERRAATASARRAGMQRALRGRA